MDCDAPEVASPAFVEQPSRYGGIEIRSISGELIALLAIRSPQETVGNLRNRLLRFAPDDLRSQYGHSRFVHECSLLPDDKCIHDLAPKMTDHVSQSTTSLSFTLVVLRPSSLAQHLAETGLEHAALVDVADAVFRSEHAKSMRNRPQTEAIVGSISAEIRANIVNWISTACLVADVGDEILHGAVLIFDTYCSLMQSPIPSEKLFPLSLACLCTQMKLASQAGRLYGEWQRILIHFGQGRFALHDVLKTEAEVLRCIGFNVWLPTTLTFLRGLSLRLCTGRGNDFLAEQMKVSSASDALQWVLSRFFAELALLHTSLQYRFPLVILAAAALGAAQYAVGSCHQWDEEEFADRHGTLLEDMVSYCPDLPQAKLLARQCEEVLLETWLNCAQGESDFKDCYSDLCSRYNQRDQSRYFEVISEDANVLHFTEQFRHLSPTAALHAFHIFDQKKQ